MIDLHCHILPGVDDGSGNIADSVEMAQTAAEAGTTAIAVTPHANIPGLYQNDWGSFLTEKLADTQRVLNQRNIPVTLCPGQEIFLAGAFEEKMKRGILIPLNFSRYPLVEVDMEEDMNAALDKIRRVAAMGFVPIVAHPERYEFVMRNEDAPEKIRQCGAFLQINRGSVMGRFGRRQQKAAMRMLFHYQADFVASDAHSPYSRTPYLLDAHEWISENISIGYANFLMEENPKKVLADQPLCHI